MKINALNKTAILKKKALLFSFIAALVLFSSCTSGANTIKQEKQTEITVFAAASLTESFTEIGKEFEKEEGGRAKVRFNFGGSQALKLSLDNGAKADLFVSASQNYMDDLITSGMIGENKTLLKNRIVIIKNKESKYKIEKLSDLSAQGIKIAVGEKSVPVGMYWEKAFEKSVAGGEISQEQKEAIAKNIKTKELNVKDVVSKVALNEVDAGVVYKSDVTEENRSKLEEISVPVFEEFLAIYPVGIIKDSDVKDEALKFYNYLFSKKGREILSKYRFILD